MDARDSTPPSVEALGLGSCDAATLPLISVNAGCDDEGTPDVLIAFSHWCNVDALLSMPPKVEELGFGRSAPLIARSETAPVDPFGVARNRFAVCPVAAVTANVPLVVTGEPLTESQEGAVRETLVTVPLPPPLPVACMARAVVPSTSTMNSCVRQELAVIALVMPPMTVEGQANV